MAVEKPQPQPTLKPLGDKPSPKAIPIDDDVEHADWLHKKPPPPKK